MKESRLKALVLSRGPSYVSFVSAARSTDKKAKALVKRGRSATCGGDGPDVGAERLQVVLPLPLRVRVEEEGRQSDGKGGQPDQGDHHPHPALRHPCPEGEDDGEKPVSGDGHQGHDTGHHGRHWPVRNRISLVTKQ